MYYFIHSKQYVSHVQNNTENGCVGHISCVIPSGENNVEPFYCNRNIYEKKIIDERIRIYDHDNKFPRLISC